MSKVVKSKTLFEDISRNLDCKIKDDNGEHLTDHFFYTKQNIKYSHFSSITNIILEFKFFLIINRPSSTFQIYVTYFKYGVATLY